MNTPVKRAKSTALGNKSNPNRSPTKHPNGLFPPKITLLIRYYNLHMTFATAKKIFQATAPISTLAGLILLYMYG